MKREPLLMHTKPRTRNKTYSKHISQWIQHQWRSVSLLFFRNIRDDHSLLSRTLELARAFLVMCIILALVSLVLVWVGILSLVLSVPFAYGTRSVMLYGAPVSCTIPLALDFSQWNESHRVFATARLNANKFHVKPLRNDYTFAFNEMLKLRSSSSYDMELWLTVGSNVKPTMMTAHLELMEPTGKGDFCEESSREDRGHDQACVVAKSFGSSAIYPRPWYIQLWNFVITGNALLLLDLSYDTRTITPLVRRFIPESNDVQAVDLVLELSQWQPHFLVEKAELRVEAVPAFFFKWFIERHPIKSLVSLILFYFVLLFTGILVTLAILTLRWLSRRAADNDY